LRNDFRQRFSVFFRPSQTWSSLPRRDTPPASGGGMENALREGQRKIPRTGLKSRQKTAPEPCRSELANLVQRRRREGGRGSETRNEPGRRRSIKTGQMQGARGVDSEAYQKVRRRNGDEAQRRRWPVFIDPHSCSRRGITRHRYSSPFSPPGFTSAARSGAFSEISTSSESTNRRTSSR